jgi:magnesium transporter
MKFLTVFSSIFIPLTFLAGVYGMNFDYLPELHWKWAYPLLWLVFLLTTLGLLAFFKRKKWF